MAKIKICGLRRIEDVAMVNRWHPDYAGMILAEGRKRTITADNALLLRKQLDPTIQAVGVFVNQNPDWILELHRKDCFDMIQLHGAETPETVQYLKENCDATIIKALSVKDGSEADRWQDSPVDYLLLDNGIGGTGECFDWSLFSRLAKEKPFFIAGGISQSNVSEVIQRFSPYAVDVSGGVETDGVKDENKIRNLIEIVRS